MHVWLNFFIFFRETSEITARTSDEHYYNLNHFESKLTPFAFRIDKTTTL